MLEPSPFFDPAAPRGDLDTFLDEVDRALETVVPAEYEHLLLAAAARNDQPLAA
jgi:hypothetical protein